MLHWATSVCLTVFFESPYSFRQKAVVVQVAVRLHGCRVSLMLRFGLNEVVWMAHELVITFYYGWIGILSVKDSHH